jgi:hypothetical protein
LKWNWLFKLTRICWFIIGDMVWWYFLQVEIMCRGQPVLPSLQMHNLVDLWFCTSSTSKKLPASVGSSAKDFVMALSYCRKTLPHWDSPLSYLFILCGGLLLYIDIQLRGGKTQVFLLGNLFIYFFNVRDLCDLLLIISKCIPSNFVLYALFAVFLGLWIFNTTNWPNNSGWGWSSYMSQMGFFSTLRNYQNTSVCYLGCARN